MPFATWMPLSCRCWPGTWNATRRSLTRTTGSCGALHGEKHTTKAAFQMLAGPQDFNEIPENYTAKSSFQMPTGSQNLKRGIPENYRPNFPFRHQPIHKTSNEIAENYTAQPPFQAPTDLQNLKRDSRELHNPICLSDTITRDQSLEYKFSRVVRHCLLNIPAYFWQTNLFPT